jgi:beta-glucuronidase
VRLFQEHTVRDCRVLDGLWTFAFSSDGSEPTDPQTLIAVPGCWDTTITHGLKRGVGFYRRQFKVSETGRYLLRFNGAANQATVRVDGYVLAEHYGSHTSFVTKPIELESGEHELAVRVDNRFGAHNTMLLKKCGWYCFGGLHRSVTLEKLGDVRIEALQIRTDNLVGDRASLAVALTVRNLSGHDISRRVELSIDDLWHDSVILHIGAGQRATATQEVKLSGITPWSPESPTLYTATARCENDDLIDRFGIRTVACRGRDILLNGQAVKLRGINHHDYHPESGYTSDLLRMKRDLDFVKDLGLNAIRTSHYPKDHLFLDLCDTMGVLVWEETPGWQNGPDDMRTDAFLRDHLGVIEELVSDHFNHPCVVVWGLLNELRSEYADLRPVMGQLIDRFKQLDPTRPVSYATNRLIHMSNRDTMLDMIDILTPNLYNRWYKELMGPENGNPKAFLEKQLAWFAENQLGDKPVIVGEFGADARPGLRSIDRRRWSEEGQTDIVLDALALYDTHPGIAGFFIWMLTDTACSESEELHRPGYNHKGLLDVHRNPKDAYYAVRQYLRGPAAIARDGSLATPESLQTPSATA